MRRSNVSQLININIEFDGYPNANIFEQKI